MNRRHLIIAAATELFTREGYAAVSMGDVAEAVAIGPSALYRHFSGKQELLATVVAAALATLDEAITTAADEPAADVVDALSAGVLGHRGVGVLWQREARQLSPADRTRIQSAVNLVGTRFAAFIATRRPDVTAMQTELLAWSGLAVATSVSHHDMALAEPAFTTLLSELITAAIDAPIADVTSMPKSSAGPLALPTQSRRETLLAESTKLFALNGFAAVSIEDIGASIGIKRPSVYNHFAAKSDILVAAMMRGDEWLRIDMQRSFAKASDARDGLKRLLESYGAFVLENPHLIRVPVCDAAHLPEPERHRSRAAQYSYLAEWVGLLRQVHPQWDPTAARIRVQAVQTMMDDVALTPSLRDCIGVKTALVTIGAELLATTGGARGIEP